VRVRPCYAQGLNHAGGSPAAGPCSATATGPCGYLSVILHAQPARLSAARLSRRSKKPLPPGSEHTSAQHTGRLARSTRGSQEGPAGSHQPLMQCNHAQGSQRSRRTSRAWTWGIRQTPPAQVCKHCHLCLVRKWSLADSACSKQDANHCCMPPRQKQHQHGCLLHGACRASKLTRLAPALPRFPWRCRGCSRGVGREHITRWTSAAAGTRAAGAGAGGCRVGCGHPGAG
jgi:hypothetical protein